MSTRRREVMQRLLGATAGALVPASFLARAAHTQPRADVVFLAPGSAAYEQHRMVFNKRIVARPKVIAVCRAETGVVRAVQRANEEGLPIAIKSGGHSFEGFSLNAGGMVVDVSSMNALELTGDHKLLAGPGCRLSALYDLVLRQGRLLPAGTCGGVGLAGLTLGGGYGFFSRKYGLTCDNLERVRLVDAAGTVHDSSDDAELLWACRGGGTGGLGIVTALEYATHPAPRLLHSFRYRHRMSTPQEGLALASQWASIVRDLPAEAYSAFVANGSTVTTLVTTYLANAKDPRLTKSLAALSKGSLRADAFNDDPLLEGLQRYVGQKGPLYFKNSSAGFYDDVAPNASAISAILDAVLRLRGVIFQINTFGPLPAGPAAAFAHRRFALIGEVQAYWDEPAAEARMLDAMGRLQTILNASGIDAHYVNYPDLAIPKWPQAYYGADHYKRLQSVKKRLDAADRFHHPQSIRLPG